MTTKKWGAKLCAVGISFQRGTRLYIYRTVVRKELSSSCEKGNTMPLT